jgi:hypothetical protein
MKMPFSSPSQIFQIVDRITPPNTLLKIDFTTFLDTESGSRLALHSSSSSSSNRWLFLCGLSSSAWALEEVLPFLKLH